METADMKKQEGQPEVEFVYLKTNDDAKFHMPWNATVQEVWDKAYAELGEKRDAKDELECQSGKSLKDYLSLTLADLRDRHICPNRKFQIKGETGGA